MTKFYKTKNGRLINLSYVIEIELVNDNQYIDGRTRYFIRLHLINDKYFELKYDSDKERNEEYSKIIKAIFDYE